MTAGDSATRQLREMLADSVGHPSAEKLAALATQYAQNPSWSAHALFSGTEPFGIIGLEVPGNVREGFGKGRCRQHPQRLAAVPAAVDGHE